MVNVMRAVMFSCLSCDRYTKPIGTKKEEFILQ